MRTESGSDSVRELDGDTGANLEAHRERESHGDKLEEVRRALLMA